MTEAGRRGNVSRRLLFVYAAWRLNPLCAMLSPLALGWVFFYSYTKRFTRWCHLVLGVGMSIAPVGGYLAVTGQWSRPWWMLVALALAVATWGGGFDILYALQDVAFDKSQRLYSLPVAFGEARALLVRTRVARVHGRVPGAGRCGHDVYWNRRRVVSTHLESLSRQGCSSTSTRSSKRTISRGWMPRSS